MKSTGAKWLVVTVIWLVVVAVGAGAWFVLVRPARVEARELAEARAEYGRLVEQARARGLDPAEVDEDADADDLRAAAESLRRRMTGSRPASPAAVDLDLTVPVALDSFSGYAVLRDPAFAADLAAAGIGLELVDDGADYAKRMRDLASGRVPVAAFTIDALLTSSADIGSVPGTIVMLIDETTGADAMVAYEAAVPTLDALNHPDASIVLTPDSPSETLARVTRASFDLSQMPADFEEAFEEADGADDVLARLRSADPAQRRAYVLWEPALSRALGQDGVRVLLDSSRFRGFIVDVLVVNRDWLLENEPAVTEIVRAYQRGLYAANRAGWASVLKADARRTGEALTDEQAARIADGIWWKTTQDNYAHFGISESGGGGGRQPLGVMIRQIVRVLVETGGLDADPTGGDPAALYYDGVLRTLQAENFHPGSGAGDEAERAETPAVALNEAQWQSLEPVGTLQVRRLVFPPGGSTLSRTSQLALDELAETLSSFPQFYVRVIGSASRRGDAELNRQLADARAQAAAEYLAAAGVPAERVRAVAAEPAEGRAAAAVRFEVGQLPY